MLIGDDCVVYKSILFKAIKKKASDFTWYLICLSSLSLLFVVVRLIYIDVF